MQSGYYCRCREGYTGSTSCYFIEGPFAIDVQLALIISEDCSSWTNDEYSGRKAADLRQHFIQYLALECGQDCTLEQDSLPISYLSCPSAQDKSVMFHIRIAVVLPVVRWPEIRQKMRSAVEKWPLSSSQLSVAGSAVIISKTCTSTDISPIENDCTNAVHSEEDSTASSDKISDTTAIAIIVVLSAFSVGLLTAFVAVCFTRVRNSGDKSDTDRRLYTDIELVHMEENRRPGWSFRDRQPPPELGPSFHRYDIPASIREDECEEESNSEDASEEEPENVVFENVLY
jgi:hypothetical protein